MREAINPFAKKSVVPSFVLTASTAKTTVTEYVISGRTQLFEHVLVFLLAVMRILTKREPYLSLKLRVNAAFVAETSAFMARTK